MTVVSDAAKILKTINIKGIDNVYSFFIPQDKLSAVATTDVLITDVGELLTEYGSDKNIEKARTVAINIYKGANAKGSLDEIDNWIENTFEEAGWKAVYSGPITLNPETRQKVKAYQFRDYRKREF